MAELETRVDRLEGRVTSLEVTVEKLSQKVDDFIEENRAFRERQDADIREIRQSIASMGSHVRNMSVVTIIGVAAMVIAVLLK